MADTLTANYGWILPEDQASPDTWGAKLNANFQAIDGQVYANALQTGGLNAYGVTFMTDATHDAGIQFVNSLAPSGQQLRWQLGMQNNAETGSNAGSDFSLAAYTDTGATLSAPLTVIRQTGAIIIGTALTAPFGSSNGVVFQQIPSSNVALTLVGTSLFSGMRMTDNNGNQQVLFTGSGSGASAAMSLSKLGASLSLNATNDFTFSGSSNAYKTSGGSWTAISDARIKTVDGEYEAGLEAVLALRPVVYRYKGNHEALSHPYYPSYKQFVGLIAQEAEAVMPDLVTLHEGVIDGQEVTDLRALDPSNLVYALINAVKELKAEIQALREASGL